MLLSIHLSHYHFEMNLTGPEEFCHVKNWQISETIWDIHALDFRTGYYVGTNNLTLQCNLAGILLRFAQNPANTMLIDITITTKYCGNRFKKIGPVQYLGFTLFAFLCGDCGMFSFCFHFSFILSLSAQQPKFQQTACLSPQLLIHHHHGYSPSQVLWKPFR